MLADKQGQLRNGSYPIPIASDLDDVNELVRIYKRSILKYALLSLRDNDLAETVTQDCFLRAFNSRALYRGECSVHTWLMTIATNLIRDKTRTRRFQFWKQVNASAVELSTMENSIAAHQQSPESNLLMRETLGRIWDTVDMLPERQRTVFLLRFAGEMELSEIAWTTGIKLSSVKSHLYRALCTVRQRLGQAISQSRHKCTKSEPLIDQNCALI